MFTQFVSYFLGTIVHPAVTFRELARQPSIRPAVMLAALSLLLAWLNLLLTFAVGGDWLGTRRELSDPTFVGFFGRLPVTLEAWVPFFFVVILPLQSLLGLAAVPGLAHLLCKLWRGQGTFEGTVNALAFAVGVPGVVIHSLSELLFTAPANVLSGHPYWWAAAMNGEFGPLAATLWNLFVIGVYAVGADLWIITLVTIALRHTQGVPWWAAALIAVFVHVLWTYGLMATFVR